MFVRGTNRHAPRTSGIRLRTLPRQRRHLGMCPQSRWRWDYGTWSGCPRVRPVDALDCPERRMLREETTQRALGGPEGRQANSALVLTSSLGDPCASHLDGLGELSAAAKIEK